MDIVSQKSENTEEEKVNELLENYKEQKALKKSKEYPNCKKIWLIKNKKTKRVVEIKAPTIMLAATSVGWRVRHIILLEERTLED